MALSPLCPLYEQRFSRFLGHSQQLSRRSLGSVRGYKETIVYRDEKDRNPVQADALRIASTMEVRSHWRVPVNHELLRQGGPQVIPLNRTPCSLAQKALADSTLLQTICY